MEPTASHDVTRLLLAWNDGDAAALEHLTPIVHAELRRLARRYLQTERAGHTLQTNALVNEAYLRLVDADRVQWQNRAHFLTISARLMRQILVDHARRHSYQKRGGNASVLSLDWVNAAGPPLDHDLCSVDDALLRLAKVDARKSQVVELRFFGGLSEAEAAEVLKVSVQTVKRDWRLAKAWLRSELRGTQT
jgi:RNA polymerase sigma-70 factor, ECF subfamily